MNVINPFAGALAQTPALQKQQATEKASQIRHLQELKRNIAPRGDDEYEHVVESAEELRPARELRDDDPRKRKKQPPSSGPDAETGQDPAGIDLTA